MAETAEEEEVTTEEEAAEEIQEEPKESVEEEAAEEEEEPVKKPKKSIDDRLAEISTATWEMREAERKANEAAAKAEAATKKLEETAAKAGDPKPAMDDYDTTEEYVDALTDWKVKQVAPEKKETPVESTEPPALRTYNQKKEKALIKNPDYAKHEDLVTRMLRHYKNEAVATLLIESEQSTQLVTHFGKNPNELERIAMLSPISVAKEMGKLEDKFIKVPKRSKTPKPISPVGGGNSGKVATDYSNMSDEEYQAKRNKEQYGK